MNNCPFCEELNDKTSNLTGRNRIIAETENFVVFPTTGGFVENYLLIVPKKHINCFGELTEKELSELKEIINWQKIVNKQYFKSDSSMFEHGSLFPKNESGKSIVHAHLHIFPNNINLLDTIKKYGFNIQEIDDISKLNEICHRYENYIYYNDLNNRNYVITHDGIPSQFLRKVLADSLGIKEWNWREYPLLENIEKCVQFYNIHNDVYDFIGGVSGNDSFTKQTI